MKTNIQMIKELDNFMPKRRGIISISEEAIIRKTLCMSQMDERGLRNLRDIAVMYYSILIDENQKDLRKAINIADKMSAVAATIDRELFVRGCEI